MLESMQYALRWLARQRGAIVEQMFRRSSPRSAEAGAVGLIVVESARILAAAFAGTKAEQPALIWWSRSTKNLDAITHPGFRLSGNSLVYQLSFLISCSAVTSTCTEGPMVEVT
jgi:hypothetical protein